MGKLILAKMWLFVHHPRLYHNDIQAAHDLKHQVFMTSVEVVEFGILLMQGKNTAKWAWLFKTYMQWHAVAYVLSELSHMPPGPDFDRAWKAVDSVYDKRMVARHKGQRGVLWRPLKQLYERAKVRGNQIGGQSTASPHSNADSHHTSSSGSQGMPTPGNGVLTDNWFIGANPYINPVPAVDAEFGFDFNDPMFDGPNVAPTFNANDVGGNPSRPTETTAAQMSNLPFGFISDGGEYLNGFGGQSQQLMWQPQMQQEWH